MDVTVITFDLPSDAEEELVRRFTVNRHCLMSMRKLLANRHGDTDEDRYASLRTLVRAHPPFEKVRGGGGIDHEAVRRWMRLAWTSEVQLHLPGIMGATSVLGFANAWAPVHAYYVLYGALQAWFGANGMTGLANDHIATLRSIANQILERRLLPAPWDVLCNGCLMNKRHAYLHAPDGVDLDARIQVLSIPRREDAEADFWPRYGTWLRSTRKARLEAREGKWKQTNGRLKISGAMRAEFAASLAPTSLFDCFWRMRIRANYGSIDQYLALYVDDREHLAYFRSMCEVTRATLAVLELYVARKLGKADYSELVSDYLAGDENNITAVTLGARARALGFA